MKLFHSATVKLTLWYLLILMTVTLAFSVVLYNASAQELDRPFPREIVRERTLLNNEDFLQARQALAEEGKRNLILNLVGLNIVTLALGAGASYFFARRTLQPIEEALNAQTQFVSDASHELRTPLAVMKTENEIVLRDTAQNKSGYKAVVQSNLEEVERLQALTDRLLALSSSQTLPLDNFPVSEAIQASVKRHATAARQKGITLSHQTSALLAYGNHDSVCDVISVLVDNAIKYSPEDSDVKLTAIESGRHTLIEVIDQGDGIAEKDLPHIFDRFYRADASRSKINVEGYGLGLALAKRMAELNRAELSVKNNDVSGATFTLRLLKSR